MRWGLIGASRIAANHVIDAIRAQPGHEIVSVLSSDTARGTAYAATHGIPRAVTDLDALLADADVEAVYISTTNEKHHPQALAAIAAGKHVLCEKPLGMSVAEAAEMVRAAEAAGVVFATNHHLRCAGAHRAMRDLVASGAIGEIRGARVFHAVSLPEELRGWRINDAKAGGGVIPDITVHDADTMRFLLGEDPVAVVAQSSVTGLGEGVEDSVMSVWTMPSGYTVMAHESFTTPFGHTGVHILGAKGAIIARSVMTQAPVGTVELTDADGTRNIAFDKGDLYEFALAAFDRAMKGKGRPAADGADGVKSLAVALAVREAAQTGRAVTVDYGGF